MVRTKGASKLRVGILGVGKLGLILWEGLEKSASVSLSGSVRSDRRLKELPKKVQSRVFKNNRDVVKNSDVLLLAVKPQQAFDVLEEIQADLTSKQTLVSLCAALEFVQIQSKLDKNSSEIKLLRAMPNTPSAVGEGMTVIARTRSVSDRDFSVVEGLFKALGRTLELEEKHFDAATALSGCGPAFVYVILEALSEGGVKVGLPRALATTLAAQTLLGASKMVLEKGHHPAVLRDDVTTPAGVTIDGLMALEEGHIRVTLLKAIVASYERSCFLKTQANA